MAVPVSSGSLNVQQNMAFKNQSALPNGGELIRCKFFQQSYALHTPHPYVATGEAACSVFRISGSTSLNEWVKRHEFDTGPRDGVATDERERIKALERENKELRRANEILKLASAFFAQAELGRRLKS
jgi:hypothetical protein